MQFLYKYIKDDLPNIIRTILVVVACVFFVLLTPLLIGFIIDNVINLKPLTNPIIIRLTDMVGGVSYIRENLWIGALLLIILNVFYAIGLYLRGRWNTITSENIAKRIRDAMYNHLQLLPYSFHVSAKTGDLIQRCTSDIEQIRRFFGSQVAEIFHCLATATISIIILFNLYAPLAKYAIMSMPILLGFSYFFFKRMQAIFLKCDQTEGALSAMVQENLTGIRVVKAFHQERFEFEKFDKSNASYSDYVFRMVKMLAVYWGVSDFICLFQILIVIIMGINFSVNSDLTVGVFFVFITFEGMILWPIRQLGRVLANAGKVAVSVGRLNEILDIPIEDVKTGLDIDIKGDIEFKDVVFQYHDATSPVLKKISFKVNKGQTIALMGPTGSGKSSLVHLLTRLYDYDDGSITIDGINIKDIKRECLRKQIGIVLQEPFLFSKTIEDNILIANKNHNKDDMHRATSIASVHQVIDEFDKGYQTEVGERGVTLSGGQKQRIAIARTIINNCPVMIFDDSLSAVDSDTDSRIREGLKEISDSTTLIITHRVTSAMNADKILVLEDGKITEEGTHNELLNSGGLYSRIAKIQQAMKEEVVDNE